MDDDTPRAQELRYIRTSDLREHGLSRRQIRDEVRRGGLVPLREGVFVTHGCPSECAEAVRARGRLACVSELRRLGVFVRDRHARHIHIERTSARLPPPPIGWRVHRRRLVRAVHPRSMSVDAFDALIDAVQCQDPRAAVATLDSALHQGILRGDELDELFDALPRRYRRLRALLDSRAESGPETLVRLMLRGLGCSIEVQVRIHGVGRVDLVVDGWLIIECDSKEFHSDWDAQKRDRRRDLAAAKLGYCTLRLVAEDIMWQPEVVLDALRGLLTDTRGAVVPTRRGSARVRVAG